MNNQEVDYYQAAMDGIARLQCDVKWSYELSDSFKDRVVSVLKLANQLIIDNKALRLKELEQSDNVSRWISVNEQLPKAGDYVVVALKSGLFLVSLIRKDTGRWATAATVTHWMQIPKLTQEEVQP
jgi:Protein of unknown function (DUF551)